ncbi:hypothetical protein [Bounagaea algeriensis]
MIERPAQREHFGDEVAQVENNDFRRVFLGPEHPLVGGGMPFDGASVGFGHNDSFVFQARAFLDEIQGRSELPGCMPLTHGLHNLHIQQTVTDSAHKAATVELPDHVPTALHRQPAASDRRAGGDGRGSR